MNEQDKQQDPWAWITRTWMGPILAAIALASSPLAFFEKYGFVWTFGITAVAGWLWWLMSVCNAWEERTLFHPRRRKYSGKQIGVRVLVPVFFTLVALGFLVSDIRQLDIWRQDYPRATLLNDQHGPVNKFFGDTAPRTTPAERVEYERAEWIRWMESGARQSAENAELLFIETETFSRKYHTFSLDVHDLSKHVRPCSSGVAFLVTDKRGDPWNRRTLRQVTCDFAGDGNTRLFRILVENPEPGEYLWLFLCVTPTVSNVDLNALNLQLLVRR